MLRQWVNLVDILSTEEAGGGGGAGRPGAAAVVAGEGEGALTRDASVHLGVHFAQLVKELRSEYATAVVRAPAATAPPTWPTPTCTRISNSFLCHSQSLKLAFIEAIAYWVVHWPLPPSGHVCGAAGRGAAHRGQHGHPRGHAACHSQQHACGSSGTRGAGATGGVGGKAHACTGSAECWARRPC
jgi:hypothetical protein